MPTFSKYPCLPNTQTPYSQAIKNLPFLRLGAVRLCLPAYSFVFARIVCIFGAVFSKISFIYKFV
ncbi:MAG: hypothetical protein EAZ95_18385 [Bacteroidetes bacterium]|nr:MAG: hypothetical protein EAZ95_18385 [Bacteroidota bacterium]